MARKAAEEACCLCHQTFAPKEALTAEAYRSESGYEFVNYAHDDCLRRKIAPVRKEIANLLRNDPDERTKLASKLFDKNVLPQKTFKDIKAELSAFCQHHTRSLPPHVAEQIRQRAQKLCLPVR